MLPVFSISIERYAVFPPGAAHASSICAPFWALHILHTSIELSLCAVIRPRIKSSLFAISKPFFSLNASLTMLPLSNPIPCSRRYSSSFSLVYGVCALIVIVLLSLYETIALASCSPYCSTSMVNICSGQLYFTQSAFTGSSGMDSSSTGFRAAFRMTAFTYPERAPLPISFVSFTASLHAALVGVLIYKSSHMPMRRTPLIFG